MVFILALAVISFINIRRSNQRIKLEQKNNKELNELRIAAEDALTIAEAASKSKSTFLSTFKYVPRYPHAYECGNRLYNTCYGEC